MEQEKNRKQKLLELVPTRGIEGRGRNERLRQIQRMLMWKSFSEKELDFLEREVKELSSYKCKKKETADVRTNTGRRP